MNEGVCQEINFLRSGLLLEDDGLGRMDGRLPEKSVPES
jgi:hypothetical protein